MRIPNKFNGYSADNIRLYNDPVTLTALATQAGGLGAAAAGTTLGTGAALGAAGTGAALGAAGTAAAAATIPELAGAGALGSMSGSTLAAAAPEIAGAQGIMQAAAPAAADVTAAQTLGQVSAASPGVVPEATAFTPGAPPVAPPAAPPVNPMANVPTQLSPEQLAEGQKTMQMQNAMQGPSNQEIAAKVASQQPNQFVEGIMQSDVGQMAKTGYDALSSGFDTAMKFAQKNPLLTSVGINAAQRLFQEEPKKEKYKRKDMSGFSASEPSAAVYNPVYKPTAYAVGGPVETMSAQNAVGQNMGYPQSQLQTAMYSNPMVQRPVASNVINQGIDTKVDPYTGEQKFSKGGNPYLEQLKKEEKERKEQAESMYESMQSKGAAAARTTRERSRTQLSSSPYEAAVKELQAMGKKYKIPVAVPAKTSVDVMGDPEAEIVAARGGIMRGLGGYSDGGRLLRGPGDGVSDSIPATIGHRQPARLADGEFVIPARIVSELGNGSTEAGARQLYAMMERIQKNRSKSIGKGKVAVDSKSKKHLPA